MPCCFCVCECVCVCVCVCVCRRVGELSPSLAGNSVMSHALNYCTFVAGKQSAGKSDSQHQHCGLSHDTSCKSTLLSFSKALSPWGTSTWHAGISAPSYLSVLSFIHDVWPAYSKTLYKSTQTPTHSYSHHRLTPTRICLHSSPGS